MKSNTERLSDIFNYFTSRQDFEVGHQNLVIGDKNIGYYSNSDKDYYQIKFNNVIITVNGKLPYQIESTDGDILELIQNLKIEDWLSEIEKSIDSEQTKQQIDIETLTINGKQYKLVK